jgi:hypothetical protein
MYKITVEVPEQFLPVMDEFVMRMQAGTRENWTKQVIRNMLISALCEKDVMMQFQTKNRYYTGLWP